jgi:tripartite-type tricarboxylate transporter receptor subunit TctC
MTVVGFRRVVRTLSLALVAALAFALHPARAQSDAAAGYPARTIRMVVGFAAGGGNDIIARIIGQKLSDALGQAVIVENKPGAGGQLAGGHVAAQPADGYTLLVGAAGAMAISPAIYDKMPYQTLKDFVPVSLIAAFPLILATSPQHPAKTVGELVAWMKANPDKSNYATSSPAFTLATELFKLKTGAPAVAIPYKSSNESVVSVIGGQSLLTIADPPPTVPQIKGGQLRGLAVMASERMPDLPDVASIDEAGYPGVHVSLWSGIFVPAGTPAAIVKRLEAEFRKMAQEPDVQEKFRNMATGLVGSTSEEFARIIAAESKTWRDVAKQANLKFEQ